eukprot:TRINITY_DN62170_c0_g3_i1.p1 TRINITY_DN62170_c0_g3~~TRINITY_DN62170_c0_g3_i1.p1  ORF type:complete len:433 (-),score=103.25 TRINITY_DN62170_c0_g3_i1:41-1339(-)
MGVPQDFVDHYALLGCDPDTPVEEVKKLHFERLREYHPDKRPNSPDGSTGQRLTQQLNQAWEVFRDEQAKKDYDERWKREKEATLPAHQRADIYRRRGNDAYVEARNIAKSAEGKLNFQATQNSLKKYQDAIEWYSKGIQFAGYDHRLWSNRAMCYSALEDWKRCRDDAAKCTEVKPDFFKGWFLCAKSTWMLGDRQEAVRVIDKSLLTLPQCKELHDLKAEFLNEAPSPGPGLTRSLDRSVSPAATPPASARTGSGCFPGMGDSQGSGRAGATTPPRMQRQGSFTPPRGGASTPPGGVSPPKKHSLGATAAASNAAAAKTLPVSRQNSKSPGPQRPTSGRSPGPGSRLNLDCSQTYEGSLHTGNFGMPTPSFQQGGGFGGASTPPVGGGSTPPPPPPGDWLQQPRARGGSSRRQAAAHRCSSEACCLFYFT